MIQTTIDTLAVTINSWRRQKPTASDSIYMVVITSTHAPVAKATASVLLKEGDSFHGRLHNAREKPQAARYAWSGEAGVYVHVLHVLVQRLDLATSWRRLRGLRSICAALIGPCGSSVPPRIEFLDDSKGGLSRPHAEVRHPEDRHRDQRDPALASATTSLPLLYTGRSVEDSHASTLSTN
ncbi:MAG TPA: hypothetical protein VF068_00925 [Rubrobacter sp.]